MERIVCRRNGNPGVDCGSCPVVVIAAGEMQRRRSEPTNKILLDVANACCPEGLSPRIVGDPLLLVNTNGQSSADRELLAGAEAAL